MIVLIVFFCAIVGIGLHFAFVHPIFVFVRRKRAEDERREIIERARIAAAKLATKPRELPNTRGGKLAAERQWRGA